MNGRTICVILLRFLPVKRLDSPLRFIFMFSLIVEISFFCSILIEVGIAFHLVHIMFTYFKLPLVGGPKKIK